MAIALDATATSTDSADANETWAHTVAGSDRAMFVVSTGNGKSFSDVPTYNGVSLTALESTNGRMRAWGMAAPATGANNVVLPWSGGGGGNASVSVSYTGVDQTTPYEGVQVDASATTSPSVSVTSATGDLVAGFTGNVAISLGQSIGADQTARAGGNITGTNVATLYSDEAGAGTVTHSYSRDSTFLDQLLVAWNINAAGGGGGAAYTFRGLTLLGVGG